MVGVLHVQPTAGGLTSRPSAAHERTREGIPRALVELLWLNDAITLLEERNCARGVRGKPRRIVWDWVCEHFGVDEIAAFVRAKLKARVANQGPA